MKRAIVIITLSAFIGVAQSHATELLRELWDNVVPWPGGPLVGATNGTTSLGFFSPTGAKWVVNTAVPAATNILLVDDSDDAYDWILGLTSTYGILPASHLNSTYATLSMVQPNTNDWNSGVWAARLVAANWIHNNSNAVYYFSVRLVKRGLWYGVTNNNSYAGGTNGYGPDDAALGLGFSSGNASSSYFIGAGFTRSVAANGGAGYLTADNSTDIGDCVYITTGTLGQAGYANHPADSGGPYYVRAYSGDGSGSGYLQEVEGYLGGYPALSGAYVDGGFLVGELTTATTSNATLKVKCYVAGDVTDDSPDTVAWDVVYSFIMTNNLNSLLVWMDGNNNYNPCWLDAIRVANTWAEIIGEEIIGPPTASPTNTLYPGTPVTFSVDANVDPWDAWYQWMTNGVADTNAIGVGTAYATYTITNPTTANSGTTFSVVFSNYFGLVLTSAVQTLTVLAPIPPFVVVQPAPITCYQGGQANFSVTADGPRPFSYQWKHVSGGTTNVLTSQTNQTLSITNVQSADAGSYLVTISNTYGATNSVPAALNVVVPTGYAAAVIANNPYGYWPMGETNGTLLRDYWSGHDAVIIDPTNIFCGMPGAAPGFMAFDIVYTNGALYFFGNPGTAYIGFPNNHAAVRIPNNGASAKINAPALPLFTNNMTFTCWVYEWGTGPANNGFLFCEDTNNYGIAAPDADAYGLWFASKDANDAGQLGYWWGNYNWNSTNLYLPLHQWTFVALVVSNNVATVYMGTNLLNAPLTVDNNACLQLAVDTACPVGSATNNFPLLFGRSGEGWAEGLNNAWANASVIMSDVAIFYSALPPTNIYKLYLAAVGELITYTNSAGNLVLSWPAGPLQSAPQVEGTYTNVAATSPYTVPMTGAQKFYRVGQ